MESAIILNSELRLTEIKTSVKNAMKRTVMEIIYIGDLLIEAKQIVGHGNWSGWINANFKTEGLSTSTAGRFMRVARFARLRQPANLANLEPSAAYLLTAKSAPKQAVGIILGRLAAGQTITHADVEEVIQTSKADPLKAYVQAHAPPAIIERMEDGLLAPLAAQAITQKLASISDPTLRADVLALGVSHAGVIDVLAQMKTVAPDAYAEVVASQHFQGSGDPIPVADANERDARDCYKEIRFHTHVSDWENKFDTILDTNAFLLSATPDPARPQYCQATFSISTDELSKLREFLNSSDRRGGFIRFRVPAIA